MYESFTVYGQLVPGALSLSGIVWCFPLKGVHSRPSGVLSSSNGPYGWDLAFIQREVFKKRNGIFHSCCDPCQPILFDSIGLNSHGNVSPI